MNKQMPAEESRPESGKFVDVPVRDNFYQSSSFFPMPFALITTVNERGSSWSRTRPGCLRRTPTIL
jgi:hypothetical protein